MILGRLASDENSEVGTLLAWGLEGGIWGQNRNALRGRPVRKTTAGQLGDPKQTVAASWVCCLLGKRGWKCSTYVMGAYKE